MPAAGGSPGIIEGDWGQSFDPGNCSGGCFEGLHGHCDAKPGGLAPLDWANEEFGYKKGTDTVTRISPGIVSIIKATEAKVLPCNEVI